MKPYTDACGVPIKITSIAVRKKFLKHFTDSVGNNMALVVVRVFMVAVFSRNDRWLALLIFKAPSVPNPKWLLDGARIFTGTKDFR